MPIGFVFPSMHVFASFPNVAQRLLEFQERKRAAMLVRYEGRQDVVERLERKRLERIASSKAACVQQAAPVPDAEPMEAEGDGGSAKA